MSRGRITLDKSQQKEFGKYWIDLSKIVFASLVIKLFEPGSPAITFNSVITVASGLTASLLLAMLGLRFSKEKK